MDIVDADFLIQLVEQGLDTILILCCASVLVVLMTVTPRTPILSATQ